MSETKPAVFLSYASQDVVAALRICVALRAAGIEVWFPSPTFSTTKSAATTPALSTT